jgi:ABC-type lipoprotein release transport system permease subunit
MGKEYLTDEYPMDMVAAGGYVYEETAYISKSLWTDICFEMMENSYAQASLFFENDKKAEAAAMALRDAGYIAVTSDTTYEPPAFETIAVVIACLFMGFLWFVSIVFLAFFINLCSSRSMLAFKSDMAIMRSMGIKVGVIRVAMFVRMFLSLVPAFISLAVAATLIYTSPAANQYFMFLHPWQYALIILGMLILTCRITVKQVKKLFGESVKKSLKRGDAE